MGRVGGLKRNLYIRALVAMVNVGVFGWKTATGKRYSFFGQFGSFTLLSITRSQSQQSAHKDLEPKWPKSVLMDGKLQQGQKCSFFGNSVVLFCFL
ncbi:hypothetical protein BWR10_12960 [Lacticaseibacillus rhamnosus]|uniref:Uncharacterized protein n=1 Tax=Lacticaseibacillus rhamnosus TaxID=47715 RepID=A0AAX0K0H5_LACRH|nr:hypothetical protein BWR10_12960 [Lacticaseibacillus rhamnosus]